MREFIKKIEIEGLFGLGGVVLEFKQGVNILTGHNGTFKTTILQILANALRGDFDRFAYLDFTSICIELAQGEDITLSKSSQFEEFTGSTDYLIKAKWGDFSDVLSTSEIERDEPSLNIDANKVMYNQHEETGNILKAMYVPAFRSVIEAFRTLEEDLSPANITYKIRCWRMPFVPYIGYPSLTEIEKTLMSPKITKSEIKSYVNAVNSFLEKKELVVDLERSNPDFPLVRIEHKKGIYSKLGTLSSGEREIAILMYAVTKADLHSILLFDEPENSLHVAWQRKLLDLMDEAGQFSQVIACTHSPVIASRYPAQEIVVQQDFRGVSSEIPYDF